jgi:transcriptional regulator with XRE-family HTH domain
LAVTFAKEYTVFHQDLKTYRQSRNLSQKQAGELVGVTDAAWSRWESGKRLMPLQLLRQLDGHEPLVLAWHAAHARLATKRQEVDRSRKPGPCPLTMALHLEHVGWTATRLAKESGVPVGVLRRWLAGTSQPIAAYWEALGKVCPSCLSNPHPMGKALVARYRAEWDGRTLAEWLAGLGVCDEP